jgi:hypothetical protein
MKMLRGAPRAFVTECDKAPAADWPSQGHDGVETFAASISVVATNKDLDEPL